MLTESAPAGLKRLLLQKLKRDAYIMEAGAYEEPTLAHPADFRMFFGGLCEELRGIFGEQLFVATATELRDRKTGQWQTLAGYQWDIGEKLGDQFFPETIGSRLEDDPALVGYLANPEGLLDSRFPPKGKAALANWQQQVAPAVCLMAPYLVRRGLGTSAPRDLKLLVTLPHTSHDFLHTTPYELDKGPGLGSDFDDAYFAALLLLWVPAPMFEEASLHWLEAFHISFQLAWGFPALIEERRLRASLDDQNRRLKQIQAVAETLAETLQGQVLNMTQRLLALTDPGKLIDSDFLSTLFDQRHIVVWHRDGLRIHQEHNAQGPATNSALIAFLVHRMVGDEPTGLKDGPSLVAAARTLIQSRTEFTSCAPLQSLFTETLAGESKHFEFVKDLVHHIVEPKKSPSLYSFAVRLFLSCSADDTQLELVIAGLATLRSHDFHRFDRRFAPPHELPALPKLSYAGHRTWIQPFARLVCVELQQHGRKDYAKVAQVTVTETTAFTEIRCHVTPGEHGTIEGVRSRFNTEREREVRDRSKQPQKDAPAGSPDQSEPGDGRSNGFTAASYALWKAVNSLEINGQVEAEWITDDLVLRIKA